MMNSNSPGRAKGQPLREKLREVAASAILQAAEQVFVEQGLHAAKMETIAERAGVAVGTLYNHFEDRNALLAALVEQRRLQLADVLDSSLSTYQGQPFDMQLTDFVIRFLAFCEERVSLVALMAEAEPNPSLRRQRSAAIEAIELRARELVKRGISSKDLDAAHAHALPILFLGLLKGAVEDTRSRPQTQRAPEAWARDISALILRGMGV
jgi:AcrR family transcriptional regulator